MAVGSIGVVGVLEEDVELPEDDDDRRDECDLETSMSEPHDDDDDDREGGGDASDTT